MENEAVSPAHVTKTKIANEQKKIKERSKNALRVIWYETNNDKLIKKTKLIYKDAPPKLYSTFVGSLKKGKAEKRDKNHHVVRLKDKMEKERLLNLRSDEIEALIKKEIKKANRAS